MIRARQISAQNLTLLRGLKCIAGNVGIPIIHLPLKSANETVKQSIATNTTQDRLVLILPVTNLISEASKVEDDSRLHKPTHTSEFHRNSGNCLRFQRFTIAHFIH